MRGLYAIAAGQCISLTNTATGVFSELLFAEGITTPLFQLVWAYLAVGMVYLVVCARGSERYQWPAAYKLALAGLLDVQANFCLVLGLQYTSIVSVFSILNSACVQVIVLSRIFLHKRPTVYELVGSSICLVGVSCVIVSDLAAQNWVWGGRAVGDMVALAAASLFSMYETRQVHSECGVLDQEWLQVFPLLVHDRGAWNSGHFD